MDDIQLHNNFKTRLIGSRGAVWFVADWLNDVHKQVVLIPPQFHGETRAVYRDYQDDGDLFIIPNWDFGRLDTIRVEVKRSLKVAFTGPEDYPYRNILICRQDSYDNAEPKPSRYILVSKDYSHGIIVKTSNAHNWFTKQYTDRERGLTETGYYTHHDQVEYVDFSEGRGK